MKYGWIAIVAMMAALFSTEQVAAQGTYGPEEIGAEESPLSDPDTNVDDSMSELEKLQAMDAEAPTKTVTGARPPSTTSGAAVGQAGMGTQASERERALRSVGDVGQSVRRSDEDAIPLKFQFHGYYRARYNWVGNAPMPRGSVPGTPVTNFPSKNASYGEMRLRLDPEVT
ncbi:MAG: hypothetical protein KJO57_09375, partial [Deltaproteobacteria bacterium]|nr:hypothetical protein [Deltaproteobacteria bacterium]NNK42410.1 hypothetical protein [Myxococcales bacterium]